MALTTLSTDLAQAADRLATDPATAEAEDYSWAAQSLAKGAAGIALLHIERAHTFSGAWQQAHAWITRAATGPVSAADTAGLYLGAPALAFALQAAAPRYQRPLADLHPRVTDLAHRRAAAAQDRIRRGNRPTFREYDLFYGLTGLGAYLLHRDPGGGALEDVLHYLVALTHPLVVDGRTLPGWWVDHDPHFADSAHFRGGHANFGVAHGITGPLLLLSQAARRGITVDGHWDAIETICAWLDTWRQHAEAGPWWPQWITASDLRAGHPHQARPARPSWCYGTPGIARAGQLAGIATRDTRRQHNYETALAQCLADPAQLAHLTDPGLCHGWAGLYQTVWRAAHDSANPALGNHLPGLAEQLLQHARAEEQRDSAFLEGTAGTALALGTAARNAAPASGWDACLLID